MNIKTDAKINVIFYHYMGYMPFLLNSIVYLALFMLITGTICYPLGFSFSVTYISTLTKLFVLILVLFLISVIIYAIFKKFSKINFEYNHFLLCHLLLKKHHSSSKLNLELNKLKEAIENKSQLYNDLSKSDFPYINKFISRYYSYNNNYSHKTNNHTSVKDDLLQLSKSELNKQPLMLENTLSFEQLDDVLGNLVKEQIKQKTVVTNK